MVSTDGRTDGQTDGRTDRRTDTEGYNIIPRHTLVAGYKNLENRTPLLEGVWQEINILKACKRIEE